MLLAFLTIIFYHYTPFESRNDNILKNNANEIVVTASGSIGQYDNKSCHLTHPEEVVDSIEHRTDWCSNLNSSKGDHPWLSVNLKNKKKMYITGYTICAGCCYYDWLY